MPIKAGGEIIGYNILKKRNDELGNYEVACDQQIIGSEWVHGK